MATSSRPVGCCCSAAGCPIWSAASGCSSSAWRSSASPPITCGLAQNPAMLVTSRFIQGTGEALAAPAALGLVALLFPDPARAHQGARGLGRHRRSRRHPRHGHLGSAHQHRSGHLALDLPDQHPGGGVRARGRAPAGRREPRAARSGRSDRRSGRGPTSRVRSPAPSVSSRSCTASCAAARPRGATGSWSPRLIVGVALLTAFVLIERSTRDPLVPLSFFSNRTRVATNGVTIFFSSGFFAYFYLQTLYLQQVLHWSPLKTGLSYLPFGVSISVAIGIGTGLLPQRRREVAADGGLHVLRGGPRPAQPAHDPLQLRGRHPAQHDHAGRRRRPVLPGHHQRVAAWRLRAKTRAWRPACRTRCSRSAARSASPCSPPSPCPTCTG